MLMRSGTVRCAAVQRCIGLLAGLFGTGLRLGPLEVRREAPVREESEEGTEGAMTYSSERGTEAAGDRDERRRRRPRRRRAKPEAIAAHLKSPDAEPGADEAGE